MTHSKLCGKVEHLRPSFLFVSTFLEQQNKLRQTEMEEETTRKYSTDPITFLSTKIGFSYKFAHRVVLVYKEKTYKCTNLLCKGPVCNKIFR